jgi:alkylhydroperoxidase AhpD family core domain
MDTTVEAVLADIREHAPGIAEDIEDMCREVLGVVPHIFSTMRERPDMCALSALADFSMCRPPSMDAKTAELIAVASAASLRAENCLRVHIRAAVKAGASRDEVRDTIFIASVMGKSGIMAASVRVLEEAIPETGDKK